MDTMKLLLIAVFLPLFPQSVIFNMLFEKMSQPIIRVVMLGGWPLIGIYLLGDDVKSLPVWFMVWALGTSALYGFRLLAMRDMGIWVGFLATSIWALLWVSVGSGVDTEWLYHAALGFSIPLALMVVSIRHIETRFGAAYMDLYGGLAVTTPRLSGVLVFSVLAATASPVFPAFFIMLHTIMSSTAGTMIAILGVWLLWTWGSARLLQGIIVGPAVGEKVQDIGKGLTWLYALLLVALVLIGIYLTGGQL